MLIKFTLFTIMLALGLGLQGGALNQLRQRPWMVVRALVGSCGLVPLAGLVLLMLPITTALAPVVRIGIALMVLCPSAPMTLRKAGKQGGSRELAALLQVAAALVAILSVPLLAGVFRQVFGLEGWRVEAVDVAGQVGMSQVLPLVLGLLLRRRWPAFADRIMGPLDRFANVLLVLLVVVVLVKTGPLLVPFVAANLWALVAMVVMVLITLAIGYGLAGEGREQRITVSLVTSMRNPGLALLLAQTHAAGLPGVKLTILAYLLVTVLASIPVLRRLRTLTA
jgi:predicted Na+-dependent transporter